MLYVCLSSEICSRQRVLEIIGDDLAVMKRPGSVTIHTVPEGTVQIIIDAGGAKFASFSASPERPDANFLRSSSQPTSFDPSDFAPRRRHGLGYLRSLIYAYLLSLLLHLNSLFFISVLFSVTRPRHSLPGSRSAAHQHINFLLPFRSDPIQLTVVLSLQATSQRGMKPSGDAYLSSADLRIRNYRIHHGTKSGLEAQSG